MLWVTDLERVIDDHPTQPYSMTMEKGKERKDVMEFLNDGMSAYAVKIRTSVLNSFWKKHISDKNGLRGEGPTAGGCSQRYRKPLSPSQWHWLTRLEDGMKKSGWDGRCVFVDLNERRITCDGRRRDPPLDLEPFSWNHRGKCELGD